MANGDCYLYRHFDKNGRLLYVGISFSVLKRLEQHKAAGSIWFDDIATITIEKFPDRTKAAVAEYEAIKDEQPVYNRACGCPQMYLSNLFWEQVEQAEREEREKEEERIKKEIRRQELRQERNDFRLNYNKDFPSADGKFHDPVLIWGDIE